MRRTSAGFTRAVRLAAAFGISVSSLKTLPAAEIEGLPPLGEKHGISLATPVEKTLPNGLRVIVVERPALPLLSAQLLFKRGVETDPAALAGVTRFTAELLKRGTRLRTASQLAQDIEALGGKIETGADWDATSLQLTTLSANAEPALAIVAELAREPAFAKDEIERARRETLDELRLAFEEPGTLARLAAVRVTLAAEAHPAGGTPVSIARISRKDIAAQHARIFRPDQALLVVAGRITAAQAFDLAEKLFGGWTAPVSAAAAAVENPAPPQPRVLLIDMPNAGQAAVFLAAPGIVRRAADWFPGKVANTLLGGGYTSRLNQEIRLKRGLSYGASSALSTRRNSGLFLASAQTKNESALEVVRVMQTEFTRVANEPAPSDFIQTRKSVLTGALARDVATNAGLVQRLAELALHDLPLDSLNRFSEDLDRVQPADLQTFAAAHLAASAFNIVIAGQAKILASQLRAEFPQLEIIPVRQLDLDSPTLRAGAKRAPR